MATRRMRKHPSKIKTRRLRKRISKMKCQRITRINSKLPPFHAYTCPGKLRKGANGMYRSTENSNGVFSWKKV